MCKKSVLLSVVFSVVFLSAVCAETVLDPALWMVRELDRSEVSYPDTDSLSGFSPHSGGTIPKSGTIGERKVVFLREVALEMAPEGRAAALFVGPSDYPCDFYVNGVLVGRIGHYLDYYNSSVYLANRFLIDNSLITGKDTLAVVVYPEYEQTILPVLKVGEWTGFASEVFWRNFLNISLIQASVVIACILAAFFVLLFLMGSRDPKYLWFVCICISFALSYSNMAMYHDGWLMTTFDKMSHYGLPLTIFFLFCFALEISGLREKRKLFKVWLPAFMAVPVLASCLMTLIANDKYSLYVPFSAYTTGMILPFLLVATLVLLMYCVFKKPRPDTIGAMVGFLAIVASSAHDLSSFLSGDLPFVWLVPYGYMGFVLSIFFILALDQTAVLKKIQRQSVVMEKQHETLSSIVSNLMQVSEGLVHSSNSLSGTTDETLAVVEHYGMENRACLAAFSEQAQSVEGQIAKISEQMSATASRVPDAVARQTRSAKEVTESLQKLGRQVVDSLSSVEQSNGFIRDLASDAASSRRVLESSREALAQVEATSLRVKAVLSSIAELAETTNVLSINAAIESARYGTVGKGFAVIAQEIRKLANESQASVQESFGGVEEMSRAIAESIKTHDAVREALEEIIRKSHEAAKQSAAITAVVHDEEAESRNMSESADRMILETDVLDQLSKNERALNEEVEKTLREISQNFGKIRGSLENQSAMKDTLFAAVERMREIMRVNSENIEKLKASIGRAQEAEVLLKS